MEEAFKDALKNEEVEISKIQIHREKRQLMSNITLNSLNDLELSRAFNGNYFFCIFFVFKHVQFKHNFCFEQEFHFPKMKK